MTIKIKAPVIWLDDMGKRLTQREKKYRAVPESDWRKLMRLVREVEATEIMPTPLWDALQALKEKGK